MIAFYLTNSERKVSPIVLYISYKGIRVSKYIGESVEVSKWSKKKQRAKVGVDDLELELLNEQLDKWEASAQRTINHFKDTPYLPTKAELTEYLDTEKRGGKSSQHTLFADYIETFAKRYELVRSKNRIHHYISVKHIIEDYQSYKGTKIYFEDIDQGFYNSFKHWFLDVKGHSINYFGETIKTIKMMVNEAKDADNLHSNDSVNRKGFVAPQEDVENIYLTEDELMQLYTLNITDDLVRSEHPNFDEGQIRMRTATLNKSRDMFLIGAFTGLRYSDFSRLSAENFVDGTIKIYADKTDIKSVIPVHWVVKGIIDRGYDFSTSLHPQKLNEHIKEVAKLAGLTSSVTLYKNKGGKLVSVTEPKYKLISTHTGRRSFATNAYKAGIPTIAIMKITGHKRESSFLKYIKIDDEENAQMLKSHLFFSNKK